MAEIKSTLDLVMERAARMGTATSGELRSADAHTRGRQMAAEYLDRKSEALAGLLNEQQPELQPAIRKGMIETLLRNIVLPRSEEAIERINRALAGLLDLGGHGGDISAIGREIQHILGQYLQHREQLREQLESQIRMQYEQLLAQQSGMRSEGLRIDPTMQPKFQEEWSRIQAELDGQYNQALMQHRQVLAQRLALPA